MPADQNKPQEARRLIEVLIGPCTRHAAEKVADFVAEAVTTEYGSLGAVVAIDFAPNLASPTAEAEPCEHDWRIIQPEKRCLDTAQSVWVVCIKCNQKTTKPTQFHEPTPPREEWPKPPEPRSSDRESGLSVGNPPVFLTANMIQQMAGGQARAYLRAAHNYGFWITDENPPKQRYFEWQGDIDSLSDEEAWILLRGLFE